MSPAPLRVAVLSFWHVHAAEYTEATRQHEGTELVAIWDDDGERGREAAERFATTYEPDLATVLARADVDAVVVTTPTSAHHDVMLAAIGAGKHVFTEKLLAPTVAECEEIVAAADARGLSVVVSLPRLYFGYTTAIQAVIAGGTLGELNHCRVRLSHDGATAGWLPDRFFDPEPAVGGALTDLGCHPVYLTQLFLGARPVTVTATYRSVTGRRVEDNAVVTVGYDNGAIGVIEAGFAARTPFSIELAGTSGWLRYTDEGNELLVGGGSPTTAATNIAVAEHGPDAYSQWVDHISHGTRADANVTAAIELTRLVVAANTAAAEGRTVTI